MVKKQAPRLVPLVALGAGLALLYLAFVALEKSSRPPAPAQPPSLNAANPATAADAPSPSDRRLKRELKSAPPAYLVSLPPEEIFRRAFWRQPTSRDRILQAERREWTTPAADAPAVQRWQWFLELHPSPELLRTLRDPETFGLMPIATPRPWSEPSPDPTPTWFPPATDAAFEVLQNPAGSLTLLYRAADNTLFATDTGHGFAPAVKPVTP